MIIFKEKNAVSEIIGTMILLVIAVSVFAYVFITVTSNLEPTEEINCEIVGKMESGNVIFTHYGGEPLDLDSIVTLDIAGQSESFVLRDYLDSSSKEDGVWNIGERLVLVNYTDLGNEDIDLPNVLGMVRDVNSNSLVFIGTLQEGEIISHRGGLWHFDEGTEWLTYDALGYNPPGIIIDAEWSAGVIGTCLDYNGVSDKVIVIDSNSLDIKDNITIEAWVNPSSDLATHQMTYNTS